MNTYTKKEKSAYFICTRCGTASPISAKKCSNPKCRADMQTCGRMIGQYKISGQTNGTAQKVGIILLIAALVFGGIREINRITYEKQVEAAMESYNQQMNANSQNNSNNSYGLNSDNPYLDEQSSGGYTDERWRENVLMKDRDRIVSQFYRHDILSVTFLDTFANMPSDSWDVSESQDGSVMAWTLPNGTQYDLYIAGEGGINARNCHELFADYSAVQYIDFNTAFHTEEAIDMGYMFSGCSELIALDLSNFDTSNVLSMAGMFQYCYALQWIDISNFNTSSVVDMNWMFNGCSSVEVLETNNFDTSNVTDMERMFAGCESMLYAGVSGFDTSQVTDMYMMFRGCKNLVELDVSNFDTSQVTSMCEMFSGCESLGSLDVSNFDTSNVTQIGGMFENCPCIGAGDIAHFDLSKAEDGMFVMSYGD